MKNTYFIIGLIIFYLITFFSPNKPVYFSAYIISTFFFYLSSKNIRLSLLFSLILSLFSEIGLAGSLFLMEPKELELGSGWWISPMTVLLLVLLPLSIKQKINKPHFADILVFLFFLLCALSFILYPYTNVLYGLLTLVEAIFVYFMLRLYLSKDNLPVISYLLISMLIFQSILGGLQLIKRSPVGIIAEPLTVERPYGITAVEEENLFRISGTFGHPNIYASFLLVSIPFLFLFLKKNKIFAGLLTLAIACLFFTYSRAAWAIFLLLILIWMFSAGRFTIHKRFISYKSMLLPLFILVVLSVIFGSYFFVRLETFPLAFSEGGSMNTRFKLWQEGINLIIQYPILGVGFNRSIEEYAASPTTDILNLIKPSGFYRIHNTFLEIGSETGIINLLMFISFLLLVMGTYISRKEKTGAQQAAFLGLIGLIGISSFNPFFHFSQFRLFFLLVAIILV